MQIEEANLPDALNRKTHPSYLLFMKKEDLASAVRQLRGELFSDQIVAAYEKVFSATNGADIHTSFSTLIQQIIPWIV